MTRRHILTVACFALLSSTVGAQSSGSSYFPERGEWRRRTPAETGLNAAALDDAMKYASAHESPLAKDQAIMQAQSFGASEPYDLIIGPMKERGALSGIVIHKGYVVAEWGDTKRVDMTHSVTKTFLTTVVGLAWQKGLIRDVNDKVREYMPPEVTLFEAPHNQNITWDHLLRQTSDWQGTLWGKPDWADRPEGNRNEWSNRKLYEPGTHYKYNDVRINVLSLAALNVLRRPLPDVLREELMEPIGASSTWRWYGYDNSWVDIDGRRVQSVSGGGHWGGGMFINGWDMARFGYLFLRNGKWGTRQVVSEKWIAMARTPGTANAEYGYANWFLNTGKKPLPSAPESSVTFRGNGSNIIYVDWENDLVAVVRWIDGGPALNDFIGKVLASLKPGVAGGGR